MLTLPDSKSNPWHEALALMGNELPEGLRSADFLESEYELPLAGSTFGFTDDFFGYNFGNLVLLYSAQASVLFGYMANHFCVIICSYCSCLSEENFTQIVLNGCSIVVTNFVCSPSISARQYSVAEGLDSPSRYESTH